MRGSEVVVGVTGGVAAYKAAEIVSRLVQREIGVTVVMTEAATHFVGAATFAALSGRPVAKRLFDESAFPLGAHIELAERADLFCVAPATADFLARAAHGIAKDLLSTLLLSFTGPVVMAPAMNTEMWEKPVVQRNVALVEADGVEIVAPDEGWLSCRRRGAGRMAAPETILAAILRRLGIESS